MSDDKPEEPVNNVDGTVTFACPRCGEKATERFWGPCTECRRQLRQKYSERSS